MRVVHANKKVILFAPTFRGNYIKGVRYEKIDLEYIQSKLGDDYIIIYKLHPWIDDNFIYNSSKVINANNVSIAKKKESIKNQRINFIAT